MIQRKQTLFLFQSIFLGIALLFIHSQTINNTVGQINVLLTPPKSEEFISTAGHTAAIMLNFAGLLLAFVIIFIFNKRELQVKLCWALIAVWVILGLMMAFCPFVVQNENIKSISLNPFAFIIVAVAIVATYFAIRFIKKDIELLKSADRIR